ncbi:hypothetical protein MWN33_17790 [Starkeya koreensis]|uniref:Methylase-associated X1 domain-containing protein n=1 Tax=Ancylobacter koreensis TaxID=266121 RepID=A0ABT0DRI4_9HYPH|nr:hypothetical protein [Ancylobacter koreensis]MCK0209886.1 hypothetical protein [Ancylobacter koreensis]
MNPFDAHKNILSALEWKSYAVSRSDKEPLLAFLLRALEMRDCRIVHASEPNRAPFYIVFDTPSGERQGVLVYAFFANSNHIKNRPSDEHRFQIKYGGNLKGILEVAVDPQNLVTTLFLGIDTAQGVFVAADPLMNTPAPMSRSIEFKRDHVDLIQSDGWAVWERDRRPGKSKDRPTADLEDFRTEVLVGGKQDRLLDLVALERIARGLDPGERHLVADKLKELKPNPKAVSHAVLKEFGIAPEALFDLIEGASRLKMAVRGWVAERHLFDALQSLDGVSECIRLEADGKPDLSLRWKGGAPILIECKNTLRTTYADGRPKVDFQKTRASKGDPCSRYYRPQDFPVLAACLHAVTENWEFRFALTSDLEPHKTCDGRLANMIGVAEPTFSANAGNVFDMYYARAA